MYIVELIAISSVCVSMDVGSGFYDRFNNGFNSWFNGQFDGCAGLLTSAKHLTAQTRG
jgi:hypothetical protein